MESLESKPSGQYSVTTQTQEYDVVSSLSLGNLIKEVNECLREGWRCIGVMVTEKSGNDIVYLQALSREVRYKQQSMGPR